MMPQVLRERMLVIRGKQVTFWPEDISNTFVGTVQGSPPPSEPSRWVLRAQVDREDAITLAPLRKEIDQYTDAELQELLDRARQTSSEEMR